MANNLAAFNSQAWSKRLVERLNQINVMVGLVNRNWEGDLRNNQSVQIRTAGNIAFSSYSKGGTVSYQGLTPLLETFTVSDSQLAAFDVDDIDKAQSDINAMDVYLERTVVALNDLVEAKLMGAYTGAAVTLGLASAGTGAVLTPILGTGTLAGSIASITITAGGTNFGSTAPIIQIVGGDGVGATATCSVSSQIINAVTVTAGGTNYTVVPKVVLTTATPILLDSTTGPTGIYNAFVNARTILGKQRVPTTAGTRWAVIDNDSAALLLQDTAHMIRATDLGDRVVQQALFNDAINPRKASDDVPGFIGLCAGFGVYETNHNPVSGLSKYLLFGNNQAITYASQIVLMEMMRLQTTVADAARCLVLHDKFVTAESAKRLVVINAQAT